MMLVYEVCQECAVALVNGDTSSPDLDLERLEKFLDRHGTLVNVGSRQEHDWRCDVCQQWQSGTKQMFTPLVNTTKE